MAIRVSIEPGDKLIINLHNGDGEFVLEYGEEALTLTSELPDTEGRVGEIYREEYGRGVYLDGDGAPLEVNELDGEATDTDDEDEEGDGQLPMDQTAFVAKVKRLCRDSNLVSYNENATRKMCQNCGATVLDCTYFLKSNPRIKWTDMEMHYAEFHRSSIDIEVVEALEALVE